MNTWKLPVGIAVVMLLTVPPSVFSQWTGAAPPTLPVETTILQGYHPDDLDARLNYRAPYDTRPFPSPWEDLDWHDMVWDAEYEGRAFMERFQSTLQPAQMNDLVREGIVEPGRDLKVDPLFLGPVGSIIGASNDFMLVSDGPRRPGLFGVRFPYKASWGWGGDLYLGDSGGLIWISPVYFSVHRLTRYEDGYYVYRLTDEGIWRRMGETPYVPAEIPAEGFRSP